MPKNGLIKKGAEAYLYVEDFFGKKAIKKVRHPKSYRIEQLDRRLREARSRSEAKLLFQAKRAGVPTPVVMAVWPQEYTLIMEYVKGTLLKKLLLDPTTEKNLKKKLMGQLGVLTGMLHNEHIIHGDLTTSNAIVTPNNTLLLIDFGLGYFSSELESKGEEIRVLRGALLSVHHEEFESYFTAFKRGYVKSSTDAKKILQRAKDIAQRGRYVSPQSHS
ncbi:MAG: Kae1-associated serine/threonine protein kinase [Candidatus Korarchaeota archaeon]|nr:Kae1-associated serine/threonine protein kinase [Candidatus Korarchaeota archaeon]